MQGMSERAYAAHAGLSRGAVQKARKNGRLVVYSDGSIDATASDARRAATTDPDFDAESLAALDRIVEEQGPFAGILGYSQGAAYVVQWCV